MAGRGRLRGLEKVDGTPALFATECTSRLPEIVGEREHDGLSSDGVLDALDGGSLLALTWASLAVAGSSGWPAGLQVDAGLAGAKTVDDLELGSSEGNGVLGGNIGVEEGVDVSTNNVDSGAEGSGVGLPDVKGLSGCAWAGVSSAAELALAVGDEAGKSRGTCIAVEDTLVSDDNELNQVPLAPVDDISNLLLGARDTSLADEDTKDHLHASKLACSSDGLETTAVSAVDTDGLEARSANQSNVNSDLSRALASSVVRVWGVGHSPLAAGASKTTTGAGGGRRGALWCRAGRSSRALWWSHIDGG